MAMTPAIATRRFSPPESWNGDLGQRSSGTLSSFRERWARRRASSRDAPRFTGPNSASSSTEFRNSWSSGRWRARPMAPRTTDFPASVTEPASGSRMPAATRASVDFPAPEGPMTRDRCRDGISRLTPSRIWAPPSLSWISRRLKPQEEDALPSEHEAARFEPT